MACDAGANSPSNAPIAAVSVAITWMGACAPNVAQASPAVTRAHAASASSITRRARSLSLSQPPSKVVTPSGTPYAVRTRPRLIGPPPCVSMYHGSATE
jgi:hypothetical protein